MNTDTTAIGMVTDLFVFTDKDMNQFVIQGMGTVDTDTKEYNEQVKFVAMTIGMSTNFIITNETRNVSDKGQFYLPHYPYGTIHSIIGQFEVLLIGGPEFDKLETDRKKNIN